MRKYLIILLSLFLFSCAAQKTTTVEKQPKTSVNDLKRKKVFFFAGQSNMDGRGDGDQLSETDLKRLGKVADRVQFYYNHKPVSPLQLTTPAKHTQRKFSLEKAFGPELFFGIEMAEKYPNQEFIFIKRSRGGMSLYGAWNPNWAAEKAAQMNESEQPKLFSDFVTYAKEVLKDYDQETYEIVGMLWVQGETDSGVKRWGTEPAETYGENLRNLIGEVRRKFDKPNLPFIMFQVGWGKVVKGMKQTATQDENVFLIPQSRDKNSTDFYPKNPPPVGHYVTESMKRIGEQFFEIFEKEYLSR